MNNRAQEDKIHPGMQKTYYVTNLYECESLWKALIKPECASDLWDFRVRFQNQFNNKPFFLVIEDNAGIGGMIPLSFVDDINMYVLFPGEMWGKKTWLERTPLYARNSKFLYNLLNACPENAYLRYLEIPEKIDFPELTLDEFISEEGLELKALYVED